MIYTNTKERRQYYSERLEQINGCCEICGEKERLVIDHNHSNNTIRGLLCYACNAGLGMFKERKELMLKAIGYLDRVGYALKRSKPPRKITIEFLRYIEGLFEDTSFKSDRARAKHVAVHYKISIPAAQSRVARIRRGLFLPDA